MPDNTIQIELGQLLVTLVGLATSIVLAYWRSSTKMKANKINAEKIQQDAQTLINDSFKELQAQSAAQQKEITKLSTQLNALSHENVRLAASVETVRVENAFQKQRVTDLEKQITLQDRHYNGIIAGLKAELTATKRQLDQAEDGLVKAQSSADKSERALETMTEGVTALRQQVAAQDERIATLELALVEQSEKMDKLTGMLAESNEARKKAELERDQAKAAHNMLLAEIDQKIATAVATETGTLTDAVAKLKKILVEKEQIITELEAQLLGKRLGNDDETAKAD